MFTASNACKRGWLLALTAAVGGCTSPGTPQSTGSAALRSSTFPDACAQLAGANVTGGRITSAQFVTAGQEGRDPVPEHCKIQGKLNEYTGVDGKPYAIGFELRLPQTWNSKFFFQGGGGTDGATRPAIGMLPGAGQTTNALSQGYAVVSTDAGHLNEPGPNGAFLFGVDPQARTNLGYQHLPVVTAAAKELIARTYGHPPQRSYFVGCSNGGRQGMLATQRYPDLFDGVIAVAPAYRVAEASVDALAQTQAFASVAPKGADGRPVLGNAFSPAELALVSEGILAACDALDGVKDGMVNSLRCKFDPAVLQCRSDTTSGCLSPEKVKVVDRMFKGARDSTGRLLYSDWPYDPGISAPQWRMWRLGPPTTPPQAVNTSLIAGAMSHVFTSPPTVTSDLYGYTLSFNLDTDAPKIGQATAPFTESATHFIDAASPDVSVFKAHGGKLLFFHGMADPMFSANDTVRYLQELQAKYGSETQGFARLFLIPGMNHCAGGLATDKFEGFTALTDWVEKGRAPEVVQASATAMSPWPNRTRPLCVYPKQAIYSGTGDIEDTANFTCR